MTYNLEDIILAIDDAFSPLKLFSNILENNEDEILLIHSENNTNYNFGQYNYQAFIYNKKHKILIIKKGSSDYIDDNNPNKVFQYLKSQEVIIVENKNEAVLKACELYKKLISTNNSE